MKCHYNAPMKSSFFSEACMLQASDIWLMERCYTESLSHISILKNKWKIGFDCLETRYLNLWIFCFIVHVSESFIHHARVPLRILKSIKKHDRRAVYAGGLFKQCIGLGIDHILPINSTLDFTHTLCDFYLFTYWSQSNFLMFLDAGESGHIQKFWRKTQSLQTALQCS